MLDNNGCRPSSGSSAAPNTVFVPNLSSTSAATKHRRSRPEEQGQQEERRWMPNWPCGRRSEWARIETTSIRHREETQDTGKRQPRDSRAEVIASTNNVSRKRRRRKGLWPVISTWPLIVISCTTLSFAIGRQELLVSAAAAAVSLPPPSIPSVSLTDTTTTEANLVIPRNGSEGVSLVNLLSPAPLVGRPDGTTLNDAPADLIRTDSSPAHFPLAGASMNESSAEVNESQSGSLNGTSANGTTTSDEVSGQRRSPITLLEGFLACIFCMLIVLTVIGNTLVILSVLTTRRLRTVTNCFVMSLAVADWLVGLFVMPPAVAVFLFEKWQLGRVLCDIWISLDVLLCTASILSLCAISIDRYLAVTQPLNYSRRRRSKRLALLMILVVWVLAVAITCPPMLGWYDSAERGSPEDCHYNQNKAYVVYSAMGSFFIPMLVMIYVYVQISCVVARRHDHMSEIEVHKNQKNRFKEVDVAELEIDLENVSEPEPSSPRRTNASSSSVATGAAAAMATASVAGAASGGCRSKQEVAFTSSGGSSSSSANNNKNFKNSQYELVGGPVPPPAMASTAKGGMMVHQGRQMSTYRGSGGGGNNNSNTNSGGGSAEQWYSNANSQSSQGVVANTSTTALKTNNIRVHQKSMSNRIMSLKRENKTTQTLAIVVGGFIACWLPFFISYLITPFLPKDAINEGVSAFLTWLGWFNSAMNPFIYALYSVDFRAAFWRLTCRRFFKNTRKPPYAANTYSIRRT